MDSNYRIVSKFTLRNHQGVLKRKAKLQLPYTTDHFMICYSSVEHGHNNVFNMATLV